MAFIFHHFLRDNLTFVFSEPSERMFVIFMLSLLLRATLSDGLTIGVIRNALLSISGANTTIINGTCQQCLCAIIGSAWDISSFNCFLNNHTCELFVEPLTNSSSVTLRNDLASVIYLLSPPKEGKISSAAGSKKSLALIDGIEQFRIC
jgi:hypothetical protein